MSAIKLRQDKNFSQFCRIVMAMSQNTIGIIPARYASTRFPGKPLVLVNGKPMIQRVYEQATQATMLSEVIVATDDDRIADCVNKFGGKVVMTSPEHQSGTDRCAEVVAKLENPAEVVINIQGDEPYIQPQQIDDLAKCFENPQTQIATLVKKLEDEEEIQKPNVVKVTRDINGFALYFSRSVIPYPRNQANVYFKHIGIYAYRLGVLMQISTLPPSSLELAEGLEQLRWLENGYRINTVVTEVESMAVDTPEDLEKINSQKI